MRAETSATAAVATLSVAVAVAGHVLAGGAASASAVPQLLALAVIAWILGEHLTGRRWLSLAVLSTLQLTTHLTLDTSAPAEAAPAPMQHSAGHDHADMADLAAATHSSSAAATHGSLADTITMSLAHLILLLAGVVLVGSTHRWVQRVLRILARLVPQLPAAAAAVPGVRAALPGVPERPRLTQRWLTSSVSRRGPPWCGVLPTPS
ncbi:hypothetical protein [Kribbella sp. CA-293567]|uniref:hypothetical protein n=1 Tax=Kribbella sp. CA-293567 TaxID=3002436 RepID=UPI0022DCFCBF|nr:hypothetical protein [Kribbella sp. CA-293567]WBQ06735.1 hypothetical protein OX958_08055 [Kribbella sp. CA-293567]